MGATAALPSAAPAAAPRRRATALADALALLLLVMAGLAAYANSFEGVFVFDDKLRIVENPQIRHLWPPWIAMVPSTRPFLELTLAFNYALTGLAPWSYHAVNLAVHLAAGALLYGIVRRMLASDTMRARHGGAARPLALAAAALWLVHPLQTESVTYVIQRAESLMGLFLLLTLYCSIRASESRSRRWPIAAVIACALGMGSKEVMVAAPLVVLVYDATFMAGSFARALRERRGLYAGLAATWLVLGAALLNHPADEHPVYLVAGLTPWRYALTQAGVILHYVRLALWPHPLTFDYLWPPVEAWTDAVPAVLAVLALLGATLVALRRGHWAGFWGAWFFLLLAPTSSIMPIADVAFEHRMYLPLASIVVLLVVGGHDLVAALGRRFDVLPSVRGGAEAVLAAILVAALGVTTARRNEDYASELALWRDTVAKRPGNARAHVNYGLALKAQGRAGEAMAQYREGLRQKPDYAEAHNNLGNVLALEGRLDEAVAQWSEALRLSPDYADPHLNLAIAATNAGDRAGAIAHYREALRVNPNHAAAHNSLGIALAREGRLDEAASHFAAAVRIDPSFVVARENLRRVEAARTRADPAR